MTYKEYKIAVVGFYQINDSYNGASEVSLSLYDSLNCKKKLFDLKNPELLDSNPFFIFFYSYLIKPLRILFQVKKVLNFLNKSKKKNYYNRGCELDWIFIYFYQNNKIFS